MTARRHLLFGFQAPMGSFGNVGSQKIRATASWPQKSAILGLCGAALGIRRDDVEGKTELFKLRLATLSKVGEVFIDYQTASGIDGWKELDALALRQAREGARATDPKLRRHYLSDVQVRVALWGDEDILERLAVALQAPRYPLFCGRKSCPLGEILPPRIVEGQGGAEAQLLEHFGFGDMGSWTFHSDEDPEAGHDAFAPGTSVILARDEPSPLPSRSFFERRVIEKTYAPAWGREIAYEDILS